MLTNSLITDISPLPIQVFDPPLRRSSQTGSPLSGDRRFAFRDSQILSDRQAFDLADNLVEISPPHAVTRRALISEGMTVEIVQATSHARLETRFRAPVHLLVVYEQGTRRAGETFVEGLSRSTLRDFARKMTFVPAGHEYREWQEPQTLARMMYVYFDPAKLQMPVDAGTAGEAFSAKLFFDDATLLDTALKLKRSLENPGWDSRSYMEALGVVLAHELVRFNQGTPRGEAQLRGGLAAWQQRVVTAYVDAHLSETIPLSTLAELARLSPCYFCRAFKQSFGMPPHRYHTNRRIEHAKALLATRAHSVTDIGLIVGYSETSSFTAAFRKVAGLTPSGYQRGLA